MVSSGICYKKDIMIHYNNAFFPRLDALHVLDASDHFELRGVVVIIRTRRLQKSTFKLTPLLLLTSGTQHNLLIDAQASNRGNTVLIMHIIEQ